MTFALQCVICSQLAGRQTKSAPAFVLAQSNNDIDYNKRLEFLDLWNLKMAKATTIKIKLESTANTGFFYVTKKNSRTMTDKIVKRKYDPIAKAHVEFKETKIK